MRIFQVLEGSSNSAVAGNQTWHRNLYEPLVDMEHDVILFSATEGRVAMQHRDAQARATFSEKLLQAFRVAHAQKPVDLFFAYLMDGMVEPGVIDEIRQTGAPTCNFSCNNAHQFDNVDGLSPHFDYNLHSEKDVREKFLAIGANPLWWPMASNPRYFKPKDVPRTIEASFVGANYALRAKYIAHLLENGVDVQAYGPGWIGGSTSTWRSVAKRYKYLLLTALSTSEAAQSSASAQLADHDLRRRVSTRFPSHCHPPVSDEDMIALYSRSHVSLGFLEVYDRHDPSRPVTQHLHLREFEAPMCGALYCTGYTNELAEMFEPDKEVLVYRNQHELLDKVRYYLRHADEAELIRRAGRARALRDHTYQRRFRELFNQIGLAQ
jgi:spore maturation protein CgeB